jgi:hypothetical protein
MIWHIFRANRECRSCSHQPLFPTPSLRQEQNTHEGLEVDSGGDCCVAGVLRNGCEKARIVTSAAPPASVLETELIPRTPERLARGKYLVEGILQCYSSSAVPAPAVPAAISTAVTTP